jgi:hypothetical protein
MTVSNGKHKLIGLADLGEGHEIMKTLSGTSRQRQINIFAKANHRFEAIHIQENILISCKVNEVDVQIGKNYR